MCPFSSKWPGLGPGSKLRGLAGVSSEMSTVRLNHARSVGWRKLQGLSCEYIPSYLCHLLQLWPGKTTLEETQRETCGPCSVQGVEVSQAGKRGRFLPSGGPGSE